VHQSVPVTSIKDLVAWGKVNPGKLDIASFGTGTSSHIYAEMLMRQIGVDMVHVPYKGAGDAVKDLLSGRVQLMFDAATTALQNINTGRLKALGVVAPVRSPFLASVPTLTEQGLKGIDMLGWRGWFGPANLPKDIVQKLNAAFVKALAHPEVKAGIEKGAFELQHLVATGERARNAQGIEGGLGPGAGEVNFLGARHRLDDSPRQFDRGRIQERERRPLRELCLNRRKHRGIRMPEQCRAGTQVVVDVLAARDIPEAAACAALYDEIQLGRELEEPKSAAGEVLARVGK
jgi:hypothetical protein